MSKSNSTASKKPSKPYENFPLFPHATKRWAKKIRGQLHYFGSWADGWEKALASYNAQAEALHAGRVSKRVSTGVSVNDLANDFLASKENALNAGELSRQTWEQYFHVCKLVRKEFGKARLVEDVGQDDFARLRKNLAKRWGPHGVGRVVQMARSLFRFAYESRVIPAPMIFGPGFKKPSKKTLRLHRAEQGAKLFNREEILLMLLTAPPQLEAMLLLAINAALGNEDCASLRESHLDLQSGWLTFPRAKTGIARRCWLWPETVAALKEVLAKRKAAKKPSDADLVFITRLGQSWATGKIGTAIAGEMRKILDNIGMEKGRGFYTLRHTFRTIADESRDQPACDYIMGHESPSMATVYRERIGDDRLKEVALHVRGWLFGKGVSQ